MKFKIGDEVILNGYIYVSSNATNPTRKISNLKTKITRIAQGARHPYNTTGDLGWCDESSLSLVKDKYEVEIELVDTDNLLSYLKNHDNKVIVMNADDLKRVLDL